MKSISDKMIRRMKMLINKSVHISDMYEKNCKEMKSFIFPKSQSQA